MQNDVSDCCCVVDIVEGMVNKGIFLNGDNGGTFLHFGSYQNSCISDPTLCGPEGEHTVVLSFDKLLLFQCLLLMVLLFFRDYFLIFLEKPWGGIAFCCSLRRESYLQWLLCVHQSLGRICGVLHTRQQPQMEGQNSRPRYDYIRNLLHIT